MKISKKILAVLYICLITLSSYSLYKDIQDRHQPVHRPLTGFAPGANQTGIVKAEVVTFVSLNLTDSLVQLGNLTNEYILNTSYEGLGEVNDVVVVKNVGSSAVEVDFWSHYSLFYDLLNDSGKS
ncbi:hypothetical protein GF351_00150, partial [Candidatus Woesearchaeota archaeon]|nr:hypothetical protein [Candidatus Woesearchaeota archaeon]